MTRSTQVRASVLVPTHDRPDTLALAVGSALVQTVRELEVIIIGDGVTPAVRERALGLKAADPRVVFMDRDKGAHHGESYRHDAIVAARGDAIFYLCDDDLFFPDHVGDLLGLLESHTFAQSLNGYIDPDGTIDFYPGDLSDPETIRWHMHEEIRYNSVSITGTAHSRQFYLDVGEQWETTPPGWWPDHYQWRRMFRHPAFAGATSHHMTALQLPTTQGGRALWTADERLAELAGWAALVAMPHAQVAFDRAVARAMLHRMERDKRGLALHKRETAALHSELEQARGAGTAPTGPATASQ